MTMLHSDVIYTTYAVGVWGGEASPRSLLSHSLWRLRRHNEWERKEFWRVRDPPNLLTGDDRVTRVIYETLGRASGEWPGCVRDKLVDTAEKLGDVERLGQMIVGAGVAAAFQVGSL